MPTSYQVSGRSPHPQENWRHVWRVSIQRRRHRTASRARTRARRSHHLVQVSSHAERVPLVWMKVCSQSLAVKPKVRINGREAPFLHLNKGRRIYEAQHKIQAYARPVPWLKSLLCFNEMVPDSSLNLTSFRACLLTLLGQAI